MKKTQVSLMTQLASTENLLLAWRTVRGNIPTYRRKRSAGPDGVSLAEYERDLAVQLGALRQALLKGRYQPQAPGLFNLPKTNGGTRQIAILNVADRVAQRAAQQVIEPLYEPNFLPCSFGFRPGRSIHDAIYCARRLRESGYGWVVDGDIATCFDSLDHNLLIELVSQRIEDDRVIDLLGKWLEIGFMRHGLPEDGSGGLGQGWQKASRRVRQGLEWAVDQISTPQRGDPYRHDQFEQGPARDWSGAAGSDSMGEEDQDAYDGLEETTREREAQRKMALQQMATGGLMLGGSWLKDGFSKLAPSILAALKTQAGREALRRGLMLGGGLAGAAAGVAISSYFLYQRMAPVSLGVLQGSPLSPLLANIYLHNFDQSVTRAGYRLVRFADDWVILCPDEAKAEAAYNHSVISLARIHLKINSQKTHILPPTERLDWLGQQIG